MRAEATGMEYGLTMFLALQSLTILSLQMEQTIIMGFTCLIARGIQLILIISRQAD